MTLFLNARHHLSHFLFVLLRVTLDESSLVIAGVNRADEGSYTCIIKSDIDESSASAHLLVMGKMYKINSCTVFIHSI